MIFLDTNVVAETMRQAPDLGVIDWLVRNDDRLALSTVVIAELAYGIEKIRHDERSPKLEANLTAWRRRLAGRIFGFDEDAALMYGRIMGTARRKGATISAPDGMIAAIALRHRGGLSTRNVEHFRMVGADWGLACVNPWS